MVYGVLPPIVFHGLAWLHCNYHWGNLPSSNTDDCAVFNLGGHYSSENCSLSLGTLGRLESYDSWNGSHVSPRHKQFYREVGIPASDRRYWCRTTLPSYELVHSSLSFARAYGDRRRLVYFLQSTWSSSRSCYVSHQYLP